MFNSDANYAVHSHDVSSQANGLELQMSGMLHHDELMPGQYQRTATMSSQTKGLELDQPKAPSHRQKKYQKFDKVASDAAGAFGTNPAARCGMLRVH